MPEELTEDELTAMERLIPESDGERPMPVKPSEIAEKWLAEFGAETRRNTSFLHALIVESRRLLEAQKNGGTPPGVSNAFFAGMEAWITNQPRSPNPYGAKCGPDNRADAWDGGWSTASAASRLREADAEIARLRLALEHYRDQCPACGGTGKQAWRISALCETEIRSCPACRTAREGLDATHDS